MDNEIQLISDGDGLAVIGDPTAVERFLVPTGWRARRTLNYIGSHLPLVRSARSRTDSLRDRRQLRSVDEIHCGVRAGRGHVPDGHQVGLRQRPCHSEGAGWPNSSRTSSSRRDRF